MKNTSIFVLIFLLWIASPTFATAQSYQTLHSDAAFEKTVDGLDEATTTARQGNKEFKTQNYVLQNTINEIEQDLEESQQQLVDFKREALRLTDEITLIDKKSKLVQERVKNLTTRKSQLTDENQRINKKLQVGEEENKQAEDTIEQLNQDIAQLQAQSQSAMNTPTGRERADLLVKLAARQKIIQDLQNQIEQHKSHVTKLGIGTSSIQKENSRLAERVAEQEDLLMNLRNQVKLINQEVNASGTRLPRTSSEVGQKVMDLQSYARVLRNSIKDLKHVVATVKPGSDAQQNKMTKILKQLQEQNQLLHRQISSMPRSQKVVETTFKNIKQLSALKKSLLSEQDDLKKKINLAESPRPAPGRNSSTQEIQTTSTEEYKASQDRVKQLQKQVTDLQKSGSVPVQFDAILTSQVTALEKQLKILQQENVALEGPNENKTQLPTSDEVKLALAQLEHRKAILSDSLNSIKNKYNDDDVSSQKMRAQEVKLQEYLQVLSNENSALQEKLLTLQMQEEKKTP